MAKKPIIKNVKWRRDDYGDYWIAELYDKDGKRLGLTGNYYDLPRPPRHEEEVLIRAEFDMLPSGVIEV